MVAKFKAAKVEGHKELRQKRYIQWSILQHYEVVPTPLLDLTQSIRVACSFAQMRGTDSTCYVYVIGFPSPGSHTIVKLRFARPGISSRFSLKQASFRHDG